MNTCQRKQQKKCYPFGKAIQSFLGYLQGTSKSAHTIKNYEGDLRNFQRFLECGIYAGATGKRTILLSHLALSDIEKYHQFLKKQGFKTNTRRRKILTLRRLLRYLTKRNKLNMDVSDQIPAPYKIERIPQTIPYNELCSKIKELPTQTEIDIRNRILFLVLTETGCLVSEVTKLRFEDFELNGMAQSGVVHISGKAQRSLPISLELYEEVQKLKEFLRARDKSGWLFLGYNRFGPFGVSISPRGVELLIRFYSERFKMPTLTPRVIRHSVVLHWLQSGLSKEDIQKRLGLKTLYAFRVFEPLIHRSNPA